VLRTALGLREKVSIFGTDYPTEDGTCVRDYIHVDDLADAHLLAMDALSSGAATAAYNLGNGTGFSVLQVVRESEQAVGRPIPATREGRRAGDPAILVASAERGRKRTWMVPPITRS